MSNMINLFTVIERMVLLHMHVGVCARTHTEHM